MPFTGFWGRWRRRQPQQDTPAKPLSFRQAEKQRAATERQVAAALVAISDEVGSVTRAIDSNRGTRPSSD